MNLHEDFTDVLVIGSEIGGAYVITGNSTVPWTVVNAFAEKTIGDFFGWSVDTNGNEIMIGCPLCNDNEGNVQTYRQDYSVHSSSSSILSRIALRAYVITATFTLLCLY